MLPRYRNFLIEHDFRAGVSTASLLTANGSFDKSMPDPIAVDGELHGTVIFDLVDEYWMARDPYGANTTKHTNTLLTSLFDKVRESVE